MNLNGLKRRAKVIRREQSIPHTQALQKAAREAGFDNYAAALTAAKQEGHVTLRMRQRGVSP